jgi:hypothetical protein
MQKKKLEELGALAEQVGVAYAERVAAIDDETKAEAALHDDVIARVRPALRAITSRQTVASDGPDHTLSDEQYLCLTDKRFMPGRKKAPAGRYARRIRGPRSRATRGRCARHGDVRWALVAVAGRVVYVEHDDRADLEL